jgi:hypothetical protein
MWGALSDEGTGLSFKIASGPRQRSHSRARVPNITDSDLWLPFSSPPTTRRNTVEVFDPASTLDSILLNWTLLYNHVARTTQRTLHLYCSEGVFTAPLHSNGSFSIVACVFIVTGMCLPSCCLAMNVYSDFTIPAFGLHVAIPNDGKNPSNSECFTPSSEPSEIYLMFSSLPLLKSPRAI